MKYKIEVHSLGYQDHAKIVDVPSLRVAKQSELKAKVEWAEANDIDFDSNFEMPFTRITKISASEAESILSSPERSKLAETAGWDLKQTRDAIAKAKT